MALHDKAVAEQTSYLMYMFDLGECSAESAGAIREKVGQLYSLMKYEVAQDGEEVTVTYSPCLAMEELRSSVTSPKYAKAVEEEILKAKALQGEIYSNAAKNMKKES